jgi:hypothetical protein
MIGKSVARSSNILVAIQIFCGFSLVQTSNKGPERRSWVSEQRKRWQAFGVCANVFGEQQKEKSVGSTCLL